MKKILAILLAIMLAFCLIPNATATGGSGSGTSGLSSGTSGSTPSITVHDLLYFTPNYTWEEIVPTWEEVEFARPMLSYFLGEPYDMVEALSLNVEYRYGIVSLNAPTIFLSDNYLFLLVNATNTYYMTPILFNDKETKTGCALLDFTNVEPGIYNAYLFNSDNTVPQ